MSILHLWGDGSSPVKSHKTWCAKSEKMLIDNYSTMSDQQLAEMIGVTVQSLKGKAYRLGLYRAKDGYHWREEQLQYLIDNYANMDAKTISDAIGKSDKAIYNKARALGLVKDARRAWTDDDLAYLKENYATTSNIDLAKKFNRKQNTLVKKANDLGLKKRKHHRVKWGKRHTKYLIDNYQTMSVEDIADYVGVSDSTVRRYMELNGLTKVNPVNIWTKEEEDYLIKNYKTMSAKEIGRELGKPLASVYDNVRKLGLRKSKEK